MSYFPLREQPLKGAYVVYQLLSTVFFRIPTWLLLAALPANRPRASWSIEQTLRIRLLRQLIKTTNKTGPLSQTPTHLAIVPGVGVNGVWVDPVPESLIAGDIRTWASKASAAPIRIPGYWMHKKNSTIRVAAAPMPGEKVIYALHGGGYAGLSAHPNDITAALPRGIMENCDVVHRVFQIEYRLSSATPYPVAGPFPTAFIDALSGYHYLVNVVGFSPSDIIIEGDSAGGNLCHALTRYLVENKLSGTHDQIPEPPSAMILLSPWVDLGTSHETPGMSAFTCQQSDYLTMRPSIKTRTKMSWVNIAFLGPHASEEAQTNRYISPASLEISPDFNGFPRTFIIAGGAEVLRDQIRTFKDRMIAYLGEGNGIDRGEDRVTYLEAADMPHDHLIFPIFNPTPTFQELGKWIAAS